MSTTRSDASPDRTLDAVGEIARQWRSERPDLDPSPLLVVGRMARITQLLNTRLRPPFARAGLGDGDFDVLAALRRSGAPYALTPGQLSTTLLVTTGAITKRLDRLEQQGLVVRRVSRTDRRGRITRLTARGRSLTDELIEAHLANESAALSALTAAERGQLAELLGRLALSLEVDPSTSDDDASPQRAGSVPSSRG